MRQLLLAYKGRCFLMVLSIVVLLGVAPILAGSISDALKITEFTPDGPFATEGRHIAATSSEIDINSRLELEFDRDRLSRDFVSLDHVASVEIEALRRRARRLTTAAAKMEEAIHLRTRIPVLIKAAQSTNDASIIKIAKDAIKHSWYLIDESIVQLVSAYQDRLEWMGMAEADAEGRSEQLEETFLNETYDWDKINQAYANEISFLERQLALLPTDTGLMVEVTAHYINRKGDKYALHLPLYNTVELCEPTRFKKLRFSMSPDEEALSLEYAKLVSQLNKAKSAGEGETALLGALFPEFLEVIDKLEKLKTNIADDLELLKSWKDKTKRLQLITEIKTRLSNTPEAKKLKKAMTGLESELESIVKDLERIDSLLDIRSMLGRQSAQEAMETILGVIGEASLKNYFGTIFDKKRWADRLEKANSFGKALDKFILSVSGSDGDFELEPLEAIKRIGDAIQTMYNETSRFANHAGQFVGKLSASSNLVLKAKNLPVAVGQRALGLTDDINTEFDLRTMCQPREDRGEVMLVVKIRDRSNKIIDKEVYRFKVRIEGWQSNIYSSLSFIQRHHSSEWNFYTPITVLFKYRPWAGKGDKAWQYLTNPGFLSGVGFSTIPLNFEETETVELGIGPSLGFLGDRILLGIGWNLMASADDRYYYFMSLRFLDVSSQLGLGGGTKK